eukprot:7391786-Prymnesium_polylepis.3
MSMRRGVIAEARFAKGVVVNTLYRKTDTRFYLAKMPPASKSAAKAKSVTKSQRAGLTFPVARLNKTMKQTSGLKRIGGSAPVYATAVTEYIVAEMCAACIRTPHHLPLPLSS